jgi:hypothetical protein
MASGVMQKLIPIWKAKEISRETKVKVYEVLVISVLFIVKLRNMEFYRGSKK